MGIMERETILQRLLECYRLHFDVYERADKQVPLVAVCEYYQTTEKYAISRKAQLWEANTEEFVYVFSVDCLTKEMFLKCQEVSVKEAMRQANIGPGHMVTYISVFFLCDRMDEEGKKAVKKWRFRKNFRLSFHGWMEGHSVAIDVQEQTVITNNPGKDFGKKIYRMLYNKLK